MHPISGLKTSGYIWAHSSEGSEAGISRASPRGEARVCVIGAEKSLEKKIGEVLSAQEKEMSEIKAKLTAPSTQMAAMMEEVKKNRIDRYRAPSRSPSPRRGDKQGCYHCGVIGHFKRECPSLGSPKGEKRMSFQDNKEVLNSKWATCEV
jgi:hypothetical protein